MQTVHVTAYMVRTLRGHYVKTNTDEGIGYVMFHTKAKAREWVEEQGKEDCFVVKVRTAITPTDSGRVERLVAVQAARPKTLSQADYQKRVEHNFYP
jgi:hypothetical protein